MSELITGIRNEIIKSNLQEYRDLFATTKPDDASDPYWQTALQFFQMLDEAQRDIFFSIIRQVMVDTISNVFGVLDGVSTLNGQEVNFELLVNGKNIVGNLQDQFLAAEEDSAE